MIPQQVGATHNSLNGIIGLFYPTSIRGRGVGFATGMGRVGAMIGLVLAGYFLSSKLVFREVIALIATPYLLVVVVCFALGRLYKGKWGPDTPEQREEGIASTSIRSAAVPGRSSPASLLSAL